MPVPPIRQRAANAREIRTSGEYVLYWMIAARRLRWNFALDHALEEARRLGKPLLILEALRCDYRWASDRLHAFVIEGMRDNAAIAAAAGIRYLAYVEPTPAAGRGLLEALAARAAAVVTDEVPTRFFKGMVSAAARRLDVRLTAVDGNGLLPLRATTKAYPTAFLFRRFLQRELLGHLADLPDPEPLRPSQPARLPEAQVPADVARRWHLASPEMLADAGATAAGLPIDHSVAALTTTTGGSGAATRALDRFVGERLSRYLADGNQPDEDATSGLSPYLHFGHVSPHQVFDAVVTRERWTTRRLAGAGRGQREGWWGVSPAAEAFLDQLVTWRELGFNTCEHRPEDYDQFSCLPDWARATLQRHAADERTHVYSREQFARAETHDRLWNAAQRQLISEGRIHNYMRMLWGKKILEWTASPEDALDVMIELNDRYALDGRDPNSYAGITWVLGRYDRPWAPERPVFGTVRYMSSENTARKLRVKEYLRRYGLGSSDAPPSLF